MTWQANPEVGDPMPYIAYDIAATTQLLCFDEFQVTHARRAAASRLPLRDTVG